MMFLFTWLIVRFHSEFSGRVKLLKICHAQVHQVDDQTCDVQSDKTIHAAGSDKQKQGLLSHIYTYLYIHHILYTNEL